MDFNNLSPASLVGGTAVIASVGGAVWGVISSLPNKISHWLRNSFTTYFEVISSDPFYVDLTAWVSDLDYTKKCRRLLATTKAGAQPSIYGDEDEKEPSEVKLMLAPGDHFFWYNKTPIWLNYSREEAKAGSYAWKETISVRSLARSRKKVESIIEDIKTKAKIIRGVNVFANAHSYWSKISVIEERPSSSLILPPGVWEHLLKDVEDFLSSKDWYRSKSIPYRRGYKFAGVPGSGKTSSVVTLASELKLDLYILNLGDAYLSHMSLLELMYKLPPGKSILLIEEVDTYFDARGFAIKKEGSKKETSTVLSLGDLLGAIDSALAVEGRVLIMTTNLDSKLDSALTRPGRCDVHIDFGYATKEQIAEMTYRILGEVEVPKFSKEVTMAEVQGYLLAKRERM